MTRAWQPPPAWRAAALFCVAVGVPALLHALPGYAGPVALGFLPLPPQQHHLAILLAGFGLWLAHGPLSRAPVPNRRGIGVAALLLCGSVALAFVMTHPSPERLARLKMLDMASGVAWTFAVYGSLLLPGVAAFGLCYPWRLVSRCLRPAAACAALGTGFLLAGIVATLWHAPLAGPALDLAAWLLRLVDPAAVTVDAGAFVIGFRGFATRVGPQCAALDGVLLFLLLAYALWRYRCGARPARTAAIAVTLAALLFLGNGIRIAGIMFIGSYDRTLGVDLFHGLAGTLMVLGMLWIFDHLAARKRA